MAVLGLQGVRGGVGTTTITAALAWSLQMLGENVLVVDACPDNLLRLSFNVDFTHRQGWARAMLDGQDWRDAGLRYTSQLEKKTILDLCSGYGDECVPLFHDAGDASNATTDQC